MLLLASQLTFRMSKTSIILKTRYHFGNVFCGFKAKMVVANDINEEGCDG